MTSGIFRVSWIGQGQIVWERLHETPNGFVSSDLHTSPLKALLQFASEKSDAAAAVPKKYNQQSFGGEHRSSTSGPFSHGPNSAKS